MFLGAEGEMPVDVAVDQRAQRCLRAAVSRERRSEDDDAAGAHDGARRPRPAEADRGEGGPRLLRPHPRLCQAAADGRGAQGLDMSEAVTFWYGCNVLR